MRGGSVYNGTMYGGCWEGVTRGTRAGYWASRLKWAGERASERVNEARHESMRHEVKVECRPCGGTDG